LTERNERKDEIFAAVDAAVSTRIVQRVAHGASVTKRKKVFSVLIRLSADTQHSQVDTFLKLDWNLEIL
jgi:hypothetical protein